jgi:hypothetical protein
MTPTASKTPRNALIAVKACQESTKPIPKLNAPQANAIQDSQMAGPTLRITMLEGISKRMYPTKKICFF